MRMTKKRLNAVKFIADGGAFNLDLTLTRAAGLPSDELYKALEGAGYRYDSKTAQWQAARPAPNGGRVSANSMFETDDGLGSGIVRLRLMAHPSDMQALIDAIKGAPVLRIDEISLSYPNRRGTGERVYITAILSTPQKPSKAKKARAK